MTAQRTTFTGRRLDLLRAVRIDRTVTDYAYRVMSVIVDHLNEKTERTFLSDDRIAFETGSGWPRKVVRARRILRDAKWLSWQRTRTANIYSVDFVKAAAVLAIIERERNARRRKASKTADKMAQIGRQRPTSPDRTFRADLDRTPASDIHLRGNTLEQEGGQERKSLEIPSLEQTKRARRGGAVLEEG